MVEVLYTSITAPVAILPDSSCPAGVTLPGCLATSMIEKSAEGEPKQGLYFVLSASFNAYEITRLWDTGQETLSVPRHVLPAGCDTARFFLNDLAHELQIASPASIPWVTGVRPPVPDDSYSPCALLVSYGSFSEPPALEGVAVTSAAGLIAKSERKQPNPAAWALVPAGIAADFYLFVGGVVTMPVWAPIGLMSESSAANEKREKKAEAKGTLPPPVAACWTVIDSAMEKGGSSNSDLPFVEFEWVPGRENAYVLRTGKRGIQRR